MSDSPDADQRLMALEVKISYLEDLTDTLNAMVARQQQQIEWLARELVQQRRSTGDAATPGSGLLDERPPHY
ncbi:MAG: SlyX family protein [Burkholderiales bacterium]|nr:SlyX family protein [Burkholderiales bacterium]